VTKKTVDPQMMTDYLLDSLSETDTEQLDEMSVTDDDFAERLRDAENDLVDAYVRGQLSGDTLARFKSHYPTSARRRNKVNFAQTFRDLLIAQPEPIQTGSRKRAAVFQFALAAVAAVMMLAGGYLMFENVRLRKEHSTLERRESELQQELARQRSSDTEKEKELARVREKLMQLEQQISPKQQRDVRVIAFNLAPQTRSIGPIPVLSIPAGTDSVDITLKLETNDFSAYTVALKNPANDKVLWSDKLKAANSLQFRLPANMLNQQNYVLELSGISASGVSEIVSSYPFRVSNE
jgi:hypothetical protein